MAVSVAALVPNALRRLWGGGTLLALRRPPNLFGRTGVWRRWRHAHIQSTCFRSSRATRTHLSPHAAIALPHQAAPTRTRRRVRRLLRGVHGPRGASPPQQLVNRGGHDAQDLPRPRARAAAQVLRPAGRPPVLVNCTTAQRPSSLSHGRPAVERAPSSRVVESIWPQ